MKNGRNTYTWGVSSIAQQRGMAERIGSEQHALDSKKRHTEKDELQRKKKRMKNHKQKAGGLVQRRVTMATRNPKREKQQTISTMGSMKVHAACMTEQGTITVRRLGELDAEFNRDGKPHTLEDVLRSAEGGTNAHWSNLSSFKTR